MSRGCRDALERRQKPILLLRASELPDCEHPAPVSRRYPVIRGHLDKATVFSDADWRAGTAKTPLKGYNMAFAHYFRMFFLSHCVGAVKYSGLTQHQLSRMLSSIVKVLLFRLDPRTGTVSLQSDKCISRLLSPTFFGWFKL